jgi:hypothetical protein
MRILLILALMLLATSARAEWFKYAETDGADLYYDPATIRREGNLRRVWEIQDLKQLGGSGELSRRVLNEFDCKDERVRSLSVSGHSGQMARGNALLSISQTNEWTYIPPDTIFGVLLRIVCKE